MATLKYKKGEFVISRNILNRAIFKGWIAREGAGTLERERQNLSMKWFFGRSRAKRRLYKATRHILRKEGAFCKRLKVRLDYLPIVIRKIGIVIHGRGHKHLYSVDSGKALVVVPRGIVQNDFNQYLEGELSDSAELQRFYGLAKRLMKEQSLEAESLFVKQFAKKNHQVDSTGRGMILGVDEDFSWKLNQVNGHYFYGYAGKHAETLDDRKVLKRFKSEMKDILQGQRVYLARLPRMEITEIADSFGVRTLVGA